jgi:class 3 adenylate cyclase
MGPLDIARSLLRRARPAARPDQPEATEVTLLFCDVVRSTELTERLGDLAAYTLIRSYHALVANWAGRCGGQELEVRGDGVLIAFDAPQPALECAVGIQRQLEDGPPESRVEVRIGIHTGRALRVDIGYFGGNVILSSRIADSAQAGEILVSAGLLERLGEPTAFPVDAEKWLSFKGFAEPSRVFAIGWQRDAARARDLRPRRTARSRGRTPSPRSAAGRPSGMLGESWQAPV